MTISNLTDATFDQTIQGSELPVLVDFWATWCAPCRAVAPVLEELAREFEGVVTIAKVDVDACPIVATRLRIQSIPTFILFDKGKPVRAIQGAQPKARFVKLLEEHVPALRPPTISVADLDALLKAGKPVSIFDIREERDYARSHLRHARCVGKEALDAAIAAAPPNATIVLVCRTGEASKVEAAKYAAGKTRVLALEKGLLEWQGSGKPTYSTKEEEELGA